MHKLRPSGISYTRLFLIAIVVWLENDWFKILAFKPDVESIEIGSFLACSITNPYRIKSSLISMFRTILLPTLVACSIAFPILYQKSTSVGLDPQFENVNRDADFYVANSSQPYQSQPLRQSAAAVRPLSTTSRPNTTTTAFPTSTNQSVSNRNVLTNSATPAMQPTSSSVQPPLQFSGGVQMMPASHLNVGTSQGVDFSQMTPDYGAAETYTFRGNANGPDLTAAPMQFVPVSNFQEVFRFDVSPLGQNNVGID